MIHSSDASIEDDADKEIGVELLRMAAVKMMPLQPACWT
jgi:hypothetical protein